MNESINGKVKVIAVSGGKGGVGKTSVAINTAVSLAEKGKRVLVLDADLGLANVDVMLGVRTEYNLSHVLAGEIDLDSVIVRGPKGIGIIPTISGSQSMTELSAIQHAGLIRAFSEMRTQFDVLIVDTAAGISGMVLNFVRASQEVLIVVCDEPTSVTDAYALIKILSRDYGVFRFKIVANMVRNLREGMALFVRLNRVTDRFLDVALELVATIPFDDNVRKAARQQQLVVETFPKSPASTAFSGLANKIISWPLPQQPGGHLEFFVERLVQKTEALKE